MSGGSWDYAYRKVEEVAERLLESPLYERQEFGRHLMEVANALHEIEWVDSGDRATPVDTEAIMKILNPIDFRQAVKQQVRLSGVVPAKAQLMLHGCDVDSSFDLLATIGNPRIEPVVQEVTVTVRLKALGGG